MSAVEPGQHGPSRDCMKERRKQEDRNGVGGQGAEYELFCATKIW